MTELSQHEARFWDLAQPFLIERPAVTRSTMMGLPCLRVEGAFFASWDRATGALLVKLPESSVDELVAGEQAKPFAPAGRRFRQWAAVPTTHFRSWSALLAQAYEYVSMHPSGQPSRKQ